MTPALRAPTVRILTSSALSVLGMLLSTGAVQAQSAALGVTVKQDSETFTLSNGIVTAVVSKRSGDLIAMTYKGKETLSPDSGGHSAVYWSHDTTGGKDIQSRVTIDPAANGGQRAEVSVKGISGGNKMGHGPGTAPDGDFPVDIDIRYSLGRDDRGVYTYTAFDHRPEYAAATMAEARIAVELDHAFDDIYVDDLRSGRYPLIKKDYDKYVYVTRQHDERAYGWTSSTTKTGWFLLNPSDEYLSGGPNKAEFTAHGEPTVLNYWKSSHYGGANVSVAAGERWTRVVGPFMFYVNEGASHEAMVADAKAQLKKEEAKWPYGWVDAEGYAKPATRKEVVGQIALDDPLSPTGNRYTGKLMVGLTKTPYTVAPPPGADIEAMKRDGRFQQSIIEWQNDGKFLQHWSKNVDPSGRFSVPHVAPGKYTLYAYADGVMGEFSKADIVVDDKGGKLDIGKLSWTPVRNGRQIWEIGKSDRDAREFNQVEHYFEPGVNTRYTQLFPNGTNFRIGQSTTQKDWFFVQSPALAPGATATIVPFSGVSGTGTATPYNILFAMPAAGNGAATLRAAFTTAGGPGIEVAVNGTPVGVLKVERPDNAITRHQIYGRFSEASLPFDAKLLRPGENKMTLTMPAGSLNNGVVYDYLRLEMKEDAPTPPAPAMLTVPVRPAAPAAAAPTQRGNREPITPAVLTVHDDARFGLPAMTAGGQRFFAQDGGIFVQQGSATPRRVVAPQAGTGTLAEWRPSPDGKRLAYAVAESAAPDAIRTVRVVDVASGNALPDELKYVRYTALAWSPDNKGFYYSRVPEPVNGAAGGFGSQEVYYHTLGGKRADDRRVLWSDRPGMLHYAEISDDGRWLVVNGSVRADGKSDITLIDLTQRYPAPYKAMRTMRNNWQFVGSNRALVYFVTDDGAERRRLVALDTSKPATPIVEVVPQTDAVLQAARLRDGQLTLSYAGANGNVVQIRALPQSGSR